MKIITSIDSKISDSTAITVGKFDGLHKGHELLVQKLFEQEKKGLCSMVLTFDISPRSVLSEPDAKLLVTNDERRILLENQGLSYFAQLPFEDEIMNLEPQEFVSRLVHNFNMKYFVCGTDFRFGAKGKGDVTLLGQLAEEYGFELEVIPKLQSHNRDISSTYIREEISAGNIPLANQLLGYEYYICGKVVHGNHLGHKIGIPTVNLLPPASKLLPPFGVYVTRVNVDGRSYHGVTNIGVKPSIEGNNPIGVETHILDFDRDVYEKSITVTFCQYLRPEQKFASVDELQAQMKRDCAEARKWFNGQG